MKDFKSGEILEVTETGNPHRPGATSKHFITVIGKDKEGIGFNYYVSSESGELLSPNRAHHSDLFIYKTAFKKVGQREFGSRSFYHHNWVVTGISAIDSRMTQQDERWAVFSLWAPDEIRSIFYEQQDKNYHIENDNMINNFINFICEGNDSKDFKLA